MSKFASIPNFVDTPESMGVALRSIKDSVEQLTGQRQGQSLGAPSMFVQELAPSNGRATVLSTGDLWIKPSTRVMSYWDGRVWTQLA